MSDFTPETKEYLGACFGDYCQGCLKEMPIKDLTVDHILPQSRWNSHAFANLQLMCRSCNSAKGARTMKEWLKSRANLSNGNLLEDFYARWLTERKRMFPLSEVE